jgi:hypothetical protein
MTDSHGPVLAHDGPPLPSTARETAGRVLTVLAAVLGPPAAAVAGFVGLILWSDCFLECGGHPDHVRGGALLALAGVLLLAGPVLAATMVRRAGWVVAAVAAPFVQLGLVGLTHWAT